MKHLLKYVVGGVLFLAGLSIAAYGFLGGEQASCILIVIGFVVAVVGSAYPVVAPYLSRSDRKRRR